MTQLPPGSEGAAALALTYASISLISSATLLWLNIVHREGWSYISLLAGGTLVSTAGSISQQIHDIVRYEDVIREQFAHRAGASNNPEVAIANASVGVDLVLYYIQYYLYNVQSLLVMFWAGELAQSVYGLGTNTRKRQILRRVNLAGKAISFLLPLTTILMLRSPVIQSHYIGFILIADLPLMLSLAIGSGLICAILTRYIRTKKKITNWNENQQSSNNQSETGASTGSTLYSSSTGKARGGVSNQKKGIHDRWLMVRFCVSFLMLAIFEVTNTLFQVQSVTNVKKDALLPEPDLTAERARTTFFLFLPGTTAGIVLFIVFGTTSACRSKICETFLPRALRTLDPSGGWRFSLKGDKRSGNNGAANDRAGMRRSQVRSIMINGGDDLEMAVVPKSEYEQPDDAIRVTRSIHIRHDDLMKPLPIIMPERSTRSPISRFANLRDYPPRESLDHQDDDEFKEERPYTGPHSPDAPRHPARGVTHYVSSSDSDDALPIMSPRPVSKK
jgi:hypothetical protein